MLLITGPSLASILAGSLGSPEVLSTAARPSRWPPTPGAVLTDETAERRGPGQLFADPQEAAHLIAQIGQRLVVDPPGGRGARADASRHRSTVSRRDGWTITV